MMTQAICVATKTVYANSGQSPSAANRNSGGAAIKNFQNEGNSSALISFFNEIYPLSEELVFCINEQAVRVLIKKGEAVVTPYNQNDGLFFIIKGVVRGYTTDEGQEITNWIKKDGEIVGSINKNHLNQPSEECWQALDDCLLIAIPQRLLEYLYEHFPEMHLIGRALNEDEARAAQERIYMHHIISAEKKFNRFNQTQASLLKRVPLRYIASYLAIQEETLLRLCSGNARECLA
jgi:CRP-like cAMP-binding protein